MTTPQEHSRPLWNDLIAAFHDHGILPDDTCQAVRQKTLDRDYRRRVLARPLELRGPLPHWWDDLWLCCQTPPHGQTSPAGAALLWIHVHLRDPTYGAHLLHVFAP